MIKKLLYTSILSVALIACSQNIPREAYFNRGTPESLLETSSEAINIKITSRASVQEVLNLLNKDQPTRADLKCVSGEALCEQTKKILQQFAVKVQYSSQPSNVVSLVYQRTLAKDCDQRYIDNPVNNANLNYPTYGCATASNMVQMITDKTQITSPKIVGKTDATKVLQVIDSYNAKAQDTTVSAGSVSGGGGSSR